MPITPLHMGPGALVKALAGRHFSLMVFGFSQVAIDIEPLVRILRGDAVLHGYTHTYIGATLIAAFSAVVGRPICQWLLDHCWPVSDLRFMQWLRGARLITWPAALSGAFIGTWSHVLLDSLMHGDMMPLWPLSEANALQLAVSIETLHAGCVLSGALALVLLFAVFVLGRGKSAAGRGP